MLISEDHRIRLVFDESLPALIATFNGFIDFEDFTRDMQKVAQVVQSKDCRSVVFDLSRMADRAHEVMDWIESHCLPEICPHNCHRLFLIWHPRYIPATRHQTNSYSRSGKEVLEVVHMTSSEDAMALARNF